MTKLNLYVKQGENVYIFQKGTQTFANLSRIRLSNIKVFWRFQNVVMLTISGYDRYVNGSKWCGDQRDVW